MSQSLANNNSDESGTVATIMFFFVVAVVFFSLKELFSPSTYNIKVLSTVALTGLRFNFNPFRNH